MVLYSVTVSVNPEKSGDWLHFMRKKHIPEIMATGAFRDWKICRIHAEEEGGESYSVQYVAHDGNALEHYFVHHAPELRKDHEAHFGQHTVAFRTILSILDEGTSRP